MGFWDYAGAASWIYNAAVAVDERRRRKHKEGDIKAEKEEAEAEEEQYQQDFWDMWRETVFGKPELIGYTGIDKGVGVSYPTGVSPPPGFDPVYGAMMGGMGTPTPLGRHIYGIEDPRMGMEMMRMMGGGMDLFKPKAVADTYDPRQLMDLLAADEMLPLFEGLPEYKEEWTRYEGMSEEERKAMTQDADEMAGQQWAMQMLSGEVPKPTFPPGSIPPIEDYLPGAGGVFGPEVPSEPSPTPYGPLHQLPDLLGGGAAQRQPQTLHEAAYGYSGGDPDRYMKFMRGAQMVMPEAGDPTRLHFAGGAATGVPGINPFTGEVESFVPPWGPEPTAPQRATTITTEDGYRVSRYSDTGEEQWRVKISEDARPLSWNELPEGELRRLWDDEGGEIIPAQDAVIHERGFEVSPATPEQWVVPEPYSEAEYKRHLADVYNESQAPVDRDLWSDFMAQSGNEAFQGMLLETVQFLSDPYGPKPDWWDTAPSKEHELLKYGAGMIMESPEAMGTVADTTAIPGGSSPESFWARFKDTISEYGGTALEAVPEAAAETVSTYVDTVRWFLTEGDPSGAESNLYRYYEAGNITEEEKVMLQAEIDAARETE